MDLDLSPAVADFTDPHYPVVWVHLGVGRV